MNFLNTIYTAFYSDACSLAPFAHIIASKLKPLFNASLHISSKRHLYVHVYSVHYTVFFAMKKFARRPAKIQKGTGVQDFLFVTICIGSLEVGLSRNTIQYLYNSYSIVGPTMKAAKVLPCVDKFVTYILVHMFQTLI